MICPKLFVSIILAIFLSFNLAITISLSASLSNLVETSSTKTTSFTDDKQQQQPVFKVPFLVLMSSEDVSVAQMPLIDDGSISVVYRLADGPAADAATANRALADVEQQREYEQQMPRQILSTSLGKSEWLQQIADSNNSAQAISGSRNREEEVASGQDADAQARKEPDRTLPPRKRREANANDEEVRGKSATAADHSNQGGDPATAGSSASASGSNNGASDAVMESSLNVTSAQFRTDAAVPGSKNNGRVLEKEEAGGRTPAEEGRAVEKESRGDGVQFSDFDVHMWLGYAFVADSFGRIHRFRLSGFDDSKSSARNLEILRDLNSNIIDLASSNVAPQAKTEHKTNFARRFNATYDGGNDGSPPSHENSSKTDAADDDANKVRNNHSGDIVTHERSGRHPTASGDSAEENRVANGGFSISAESDAVPENELRRAIKQQQQRHIDEYRPTIIWSRMKYGTQQPMATIYRSSAGNPRALSNDQQMVDDNTTTTIKGSQLQRMVNGSAAGSNEHLESGNSPDADEMNDESPVSGVPPINGRQCGNGGTHLKTEIAVDWLNNLLFVLDKCRLLVIDFDGNNELVLIDDFDDYSRPSEIKVDPIEGRLFWLQMGKFHNTIYKFDYTMINRVLERATKSNRNSSNDLSPFSKRRNDLLTSVSAGALVDDRTGELVDVTSRHYAHPIITNLPLNAKIFTIDHKHSRIYVPLPATSSDQNVLTANTTNDAEIFVSQADSNDIVTHLNSTSNGKLVTDSNINESAVDKNCTYRNIESTVGQILAYNLDGTDVGPLRGADQSSHLSGTEDMLDLTLDSDNIFLYWLTNDGKELFEEYKTHSTFYSAQHSLDGKKYMKLMHFDNGWANQPKMSPRVKIRLSDTSSASNRWIRSDSNKEQISQGSMLDDQLLLASGLNAHRHRSDLDVSRFSRHAPYIIIGITSLVVLTIYLIYAFVFQHLPARRPSSNAESVSYTQGGSLDGESHVGSSGSNNDNSDGLMNTSGPSRGFGSKFLGHPESPSFLNRFSSIGNDRTLDSCDAASSSNYNGTNAIDEHYREAALDARALYNPLASFGEWPTNMNDLSNKLYIPVEVIQDEELAAINRISIDQLEIERHNAPLGEGHFGKVLQGTITCTLDERSTFLNKSHVDQSISSGPVDSASLMAVQHRRILIPSSISSGHGSSSTSSEFVTATSYAEATNGDYLTPKSHCDGSTSAGSDYLADTNLGPDSCISYAHSSVGTTPLATTDSSGDDIKEKESNVTVIETKLKVAIKRLKDKASADEKRDFLHEAKLLASFDHPNIVQLIGICLDRGTTLIVMELMLGGDLIRYMQENIPRDNNLDNLTYDDLLSICLDIVNGCCYLEELKHIHRDLAARNCLVSSRKREERVVKLADFGLARDIYKDSYYRKLNDSAMPLKWMAYECLTQQKFTTMSDVWSFGVVMWEVMSFCLEKPYGSVEPCFMKEHLASGARLRKPNNCNEDIYRLMQDCWQINPDDRPTFQECRAVLIEIRNRISR